MDYGLFLDSKLRAHQPQGFDVAARDIDHLRLFPHQDALVRWACRKGRAAVFADTGLGKSRIQIAWAHLVHERTGLDVLMLAPLAVAEQTSDEGREIGVNVTHARDGADVRPGLNITNYERLHRFDASRFGAVVLDESSIIKHHDAKTLRVLMDAFASTPYRLCATATPAPNDWTELGTHAEFLGVCTRSEMLSEFFVHDGGETQSWRLKGHARGEFWRWVSSWGAMIQSPADLGFDASMYDLPPLQIEQVSVANDQAPKNGEMFATEARTLSERRQARRDSLRHRVDACAARVNGNEEPWIVWCELNAEADALRAAIPDAVEIRGNDTPERKEQALRDFAHGHIRVLITKPKIAGMGLNWQHCAHVAFVGVTDSYESYYQAIRRCWRFGQKRKVTAYLFVSDLEGSVRANLERKEKDAQAMMKALKVETAESVKSEVLGQRRQSNIYSDKEPIELPRFMRMGAAA
jgi:superfamily II DNA or RNA helicase